MLVLFLCFPCLNRPTLRLCSPQYSTSTYSMTSGSRGRTSTGGHSSVLELSSSRQWTITSDMVEIPHRLDIVCAITSKVRTMAVTIVKKCDPSSWMYKLFFQNWVMWKAAQKSLVVVWQKGKMVCIEWSLIHGGMRLILLLFLKSQVSPTVTVMPDSIKCSTLFEVSWELFNWFVMYFCKRETG